MKPQSNAARRAGTALMGSAVCLALSVAGCGGAGGDAAAPATPAPPVSAPPPPAPSPAPSAGCGVASPTGTVSNLHVFDGNKVSRTFELIVSPGYDRNKAVPVVFDFHGYGGTIESTRWDGFQDAIKNAGDQGIVVIPQGVMWQNYGVGWEESCTGYDMLFYDAMVTYVSTNYCVDKSRIFVTGFSWGSDMTHALACCRGNQIKGIAPFSGSERNNASCPTTRFPAARIRYGGADGAYSQASYQATTEFYRQTLACSTVSDPGTPGECRGFRGCQSALTECVFPTMLHQPASPSEAADTWKFWKSLP